MDFQLSTHYQPSLCFIYTLLKIMKLYFFKVIHVFLSFSHTAHTWVYTTHIHTHKDIFSHTYIHINSLQAFYNWKGFTLCSIFQNKRGKRRQRNVEMRYLCNILKIKNPIFQMSYRYNYTLRLPKSTITDEAVRILKCCVLNFLIQIIPILITLLSDLTASVKMKDIQSPLISELKHCIRWVLVETMPLFQKKK